MRLLSGEESKSLDRLSSDTLGIPSRVFMENAGRAAVAVLLSRYPDPKRVTMVCGCGSNGGDGFVIARVLHQRGWEVTTLLLSEIDRLNGDARANYDVLARLGADVHVVTSPEQFSGEPIQSVLRVTDIFVDALYGTGFRGELTGVERELCRSMNAGREIGRVQTFAVDMPTGVNSSTGQAVADAVRADVTVTFQLPKIGQIVYPGAEFAGEVVVVDIGLADDSLLVGPERHLSTPRSMRELFQHSVRLAPDAHKGSRGHVVVVGGSEGKHGAPVMSAYGAMRSGAGLCTVFTEAAAPQWTILPEVMVERVFDGAASDPEPSRSRVSAFVERLKSGHSAFVIGPGMGVGDCSLRVFSFILELCFSRELPTVLDADALHHLAARPELWSFVSTNTVLTPHPLEMARLLKSDVATVQADRMGAALELSAVRNCWVLLKGARSILGGPSGELYVNPHVNPALATAGSGDILSGVIGAFAARGLAPRDSVRLGAYFHGEAARFSLGVGTLATEIADGIPEAIRALLQGNESPLHYPVCGEFSSILADESA